MSLIPHEMETQFLSRRVECAMQTLSYEELVTIKCEARDGTVTLKAELSST